MFELISTGKLGIGLYLGEIKVFLAEKMPEVLIDSNYTIAGISFSVRVLKGSIKEISSDGSSLYVDAIVELVLFTDTILLEKELKSQVEARAKVSFSPAGEIAVELLDMETEMGEFHILGRRIDVLEFLKPFLLRRAEAKMIKLNDKLNRDLQDINDNQIKELLSKMGLASTMPSGFPPMSIEIMEPIIISIYRDTLCIYIGDFKLQSARDYRIAGMKFNVMPESGVVLKSSVLLSCTEEFLQFVPEVGQGEMRYRIAGFKDSEEGVKLHLNEISGVVGDIDIQVALSLHESPQGESALKASVKDMKLQNSFLNILNKIGPIQRKIYHQIEGEIAEKLKVIPSVPRGMSISILSQSSKENMGTIELGIEQENELKLSLK